MAVTLFPERHVFMQSDSWYLTNSGYISLVMRLLHVRLGSEKSVSRPGRIELDTCFTSAFSDLDSCGGRLSGRMAVSDVKAVEMLAMDEMTWLTACEYSWICTSCVWPRQ